MKPGCGCGGEFGGCRVIYKTRIRVQEQSSLSLFPVSKQQKKKRLLLFQERGLHKQGTEDIGTGKYPDNLSGVILNRDLLDSLVREKSKHLRNAGGEFDGDNLLRCKLHDRNLRKAGEFCIEQFLVLPERIHGKR